MNSAALIDLTTQKPRVLHIALATAVVLTAALLWLATRSPVVAIAYLGGATVLGLGAMAALSRRAPVAAESFAAPDWSVTVAALDRPDCAVAITDRANRLACANEAYRDWFTASTGPAALALPAGAAGEIARLQRLAWRDGHAAGRIERGGEVFAVELKRAGRADDHLVWWFSPLTKSDMAADLAGRIAGQLGAMLSAAGIEAALVGPEGRIKAAARGFARRAVGDEAATMAGEDYAAHLRTDARERIYFAREAKRGAPQVLLQVPLAEPGSDSAAAQSLMLLVDAGVGLGASANADVAGGAPQLQNLLEALPLGLAMANRDGRFLFANPAFRRAIRLGDASLPPYPSDLVVREDKPALADAVRRFAQGSASNGDMAIRLKDEPDEPVSIGLAGVRGMGEAAVLLSLADSTEETRLRRQVMQATKMQAVGQLAGGVAHDFNNVLTAIIGYCDLMLLRHTPGDSDYDDIQQIRANSNRAASLTRQLLAFSRQQTLRPEVLQLPDVVSEVSQLLKRLMGDKIKFRVHHDRDLGAIRADPQQLEQVIVNLAVNGRDAMLENGGSGRLTLATRKVPASEIRRMKSEIIPTADYTSLIVEDTGGGIPKDVLGKIFEPFFTTKEQGKGTGLGLSTVYGIVKQSGGFIFASNVRAKEGSPAGARFTLYFPVHHGAAEAPKPDNLAPVEVEDEASEFTGGGRILLVEDEDMVRAVASRALERQGYEVVLASDGDMGLEAMAENPAFDLVVTDVVMPGMDGPAMAREIRKQWPDMPVLFMSGYAEEQLRADIDIADMHFIAKPFSVSAIADKVAAVLKRK
ncbi:response regulator [Alteriqipengyuania sp. WL0013]|uniref:hybrid sensor histidine kinase/response regulator n=1 Tax=Alteriqipengyuania sp. WL0013 TaxID=3110773 RepID=UPI002CBEA509|nr:response regulator [Alteriqipengyuania sp. WL0013]MEB3414654.1 response regulator [Alteriqipengyuania sp. WL0013]